LSCSEVVVPFLGHVWKKRKAPSSFLMFVFVSVGLSVRKGQSGSYWTVLHEIWFDDLNVWHHHCVRSI